MLESLIGVLFLVLAVWRYFTWRHTANKMDLWIAALFCTAPLQLAWKYVDRRIFHLPAEIALAIDIIFGGLYIVLAVLVVKRSLPELGLQFRHNNVDKPK